MISVDIRPDAGPWLDWAEKKGIDFDIRLFIKQFPEKLGDEYDPKSVEFGQPSMRRWSQLSSAFSQVDRSDIDFRAMLAEKYVGKATAHAFTAFIMLDESIATPQEIIEDPMFSPVPENMSAKTATISSLCYWAKSKRENSEDMDEEEGTAVIKYLRRFPEALSVFGVRMISNENVDFTGTKAWNDFKVEFQSYESD